MIEKILSTDTFNTFWETLKKFEVKYENNVFCVECNKLLFKNDDWDGDIKKKCSRCGYTNKFQIWGRNVNERTRTFKLYKIISH